MHSNCLTNICLILLAVLCSMINSVHTYSLISPFEADNTMNRWLESLRYTNNRSKTNRQSQAQYPMLSHIQQHSGHRKRSAANTKPLPPHEHVCEMKIRQNYQPKFGHEQNGTRVEIQQDEHREFQTTFVECEDSSRSSCHGIDGLFTSECITVYALQTAGIRIEGSDSDFSEGLIKVPVACQCRLRRKVGHLVSADE